MNKSKKIENDSYFLFYSSDGEDPWTLKGTYDTKKECEDAMTINMEVEDLKWFVIKGKEMGYCENTSLITYSIDDVDQ